MDCQEYLARFSEYVDGRIEAESLEEMEAHRLTCLPCGRYSRLLEAGTELLRSSAPVEVPDDFRPRLDHRILHVEDGAAIARESHGTGATTVSVLAVAVLLALSAWAPVITVTAPTLELPPLVAHAPHVIFTPAFSGPTFSRNASVFPTTEFQDGFWGDSHQLLREYSNLSEPRRDYLLVRTGIQ